jgi:predicted O-methyltransferase YrrM
MSSLTDRSVAGTLDRLHEQARGDWKHFLSIAPRALAGRIRGRSLMRSVTPAQFKNIYVPVSRDAGRFLYVLARTMGARTIVEFGSSFGISTIYLAAAVRDNGGGRVITTEIEPSKCRATEEHLREAGLAEVVEVREGDALETLRGLEGPVDMLFLDGWKNLYVPVLERVQGALREGAVVIADNTNMADSKPFVDHVRRSPQFASSSLNSGSMEVAVYGPIAGSVTERFRS